MQRLPGLAREDQECSKCWEVFAQALPVPRHQRCTCSSDRGVATVNIFANRILIVFPFIFLLLFKKGSSEDLHCNGEVNKYQHLWFL